LQENGIWNIAPEQLPEFINVLLKNDVAMHIHVNGDEAIEKASHLPHTSVHGRYDTGFDELPLGLPH